MVSGPLLKTAMTLATCVTLLGLMSWNAAAFEKDKGVDVSFWVGHFAVPIFSKRGAVKIKCLFLSAQHEMMEKLREAGQIQGRWQKLQLKSRL